MKFPKLNFWRISIGAIVLLFAFLLIVTYSNHFSRTMTVKEKTNYGTGRYVKNIVVDTSGVVYTVEPMYLVGDFDAISKYASLEIGKTYRVSGYGISIPFLQMYPNITKVSTP